MADHDEDDEELEDEDEETLQLKLQQIEMKLKLKKLKGKTRVIDEEDGSNLKGSEKRKGGRIDFVLDNAGFELYCDCVYGRPRTDIAAR